MGKTRNGLTSEINLGVISIFGGACLFPLGFILGIIGLIKTFYKRSKYSKRLERTSLAASSIGLLFSIITTLCCFRAIKVIYILGVDLFALLVVPIVSIYAIGVISDEAKKNQIDLSGKISIGLTAFITEVIMILFIIIQVGMGNPFYNN